MSQRASLGNLVFVLLCVSSLIKAPAVFAAEKPLIAVQFKIVAPEFRANLALVLPDVEKKLSSDLAEYWGNRFNFYEWTSAVNQKDRRLAAILTISLERGDRGVLDWNILLIFSADVKQAGAAFDCSAGELRPPPPGLFQKVLLYSGSQEQPQGKKERLIEDVKNKIKDQDQAPFSAGLFKFTPFCRDARPLARLIIVPLSQCELKMQEGSQMNLALCAQPRGEHLASGLIPLTVTQNRIADEGPDFIQAEPANFQAHFTGLNKDYDISALFNNNNVVKPSLGLFMVRFNKGESGTCGPHATTSAP